MIKMGFVKGPHEPIRIDTFIILLIDEVEDLNMDEGTTVTFGDGSMHKIRVHVIRETADSPANKNYLA